MATLFSDDFNRADSGTVGGSWVETSGNADIVSNRMRVTTSTYITNTSAIGSADYQVRATITVPNVSAHYGIVGRFTNASNQYIACVVGNTLTWKLFKNVAGTFTQLSTSYVEGGSSRTDRVLTLSMQGSAIQLILDGTVRVSATDSALTAEGDFGTYREVGATGTQEYDDFAVLDFVTNETGTIATTIGHPTMALAGTVSAPVGSASGTIAMTMSHPTMALAGTHTAPTVPSPLHTIVLDNTGNATTLTNYPVRVDFTSTTINWVLADQHGENLRFFDTDQATPLSYIIESWDTVGKTAIVWVQVPTITGSSSKTIYHGLRTPGTADGQASTLGLLWDDFGGRDNGGYVGVGVTGEHGVIKNGKAYMPGFALASAGTPGRLIVMDCATNEILHQHATTGTYSAGTAVDAAGKIHVYSSGGASGLLERFDEVAGAEITATFRALVDWEWISYDSANDWVLMPGTTAGLQALRCTDYSQAWANTAPNSVPSGTALIGPPLIVGSYVYWVDYSWKLWKLNRTTGATVSSLQLADGGAQKTYSAVLYDAIGDRLYYCNGGGRTVYCVNPTTMLADWSVTLESASYFVQRPLSFRDNVLYVPIKLIASPQSTKVYALDCTNSGATLWTHTTAHAAGQGATQVMVDDTYVYLTAHDYSGGDVVANTGAKLYVIKRSDGTDACTPIPYFVSGASCVPYALGDGRLMAGLWFDKGWQIWKLREGGAAVVDLEVHGDIYRTGWIGDYFSGPLVGEATAESTTLDVAKWTVTGAVTQAGGRLKSRPAVNSTFATAESILTFARSSPGCAVRYKARGHDTVSPTFWSASMLYTDTSGTANPIAAGQFQTASELLYDQSGTPTPLTGAQPVQMAWHIYEVKLALPALDMTVDDVSIAHVTNWATTHNNRKVMLGSSSGNATANLRGSDYDWVLVRPYSSPEPTVSVAAASGGGNSNAAEELLLLRL